jgi:outer membrane protein assembly factor BamB
MPRSTVPFALFVLLFGVAVQTMLASGPLPPASSPASGAAPPKIVIDLDKAQKLQIPRPDKDLAPTLFKLAVSGWVLRIPGQRALATPAFYNGKLYVGGGYGSYEFYCFDAQTGKQVWKFHTNDDGPTAAVVEDGCVAFNTESCTVFVLDAGTGKCLWQEWLGDPLMSQPAISKGKLYMAYPGGQRGHAQHLGQQAVNYPGPLHTQGQQAVNYPGPLHTQGQQAVNHPGPLHSPALNSQQVQSGHRMLCADLKTGKHIWDASITADVISAPVVEGDKLYFTCMDGTSFCLNSQDGKEVWKKSDGATSAPVVAHGQLVVARKQSRANIICEGLQATSAASGQYSVQAPVAVTQAPYLQGSTNGTVGPQGADKMGWFKKQDSSVGFGGGAPPNAQMSKAAANMGISSVAGAWGYQGSKASYKNGKFFNSQGTQVNALDRDGKTVKWQGQARGNFINGQSHVFNPPSLGQQNMYLCSGDGHVVSVKQSDGHVDFMYATPFPISFQPALAGGRIFIPTGDGYLVCLDTANPDADGWTAWGGNAQHNKQD